MLLCPQNRDPAPTLGYFFRSTCLAPPPPSARPRRRPGRFPDLACRRPRPCAPAPPRFLASRHLVPGGLPDPTPAPAASAPRGRPRAPPPRRHPGLVATVPGSPAAPAPPRTSSSSRPCGHAPPRPRPVRAAAPPRPRRRPGQGPLLI